MVSKRLCPLVPGPCSSGCRVPTAPVWAALCAARTASHAVTAPPPPRHGELCKAPGQRRIARSSAARTRLAPACRDARHAQRCVEPRSRPNVAGHTQRLADGRTRSMIAPICPQPLCGRATRYADAPLPPRRGGQPERSVHPAADRAQLDCPHPPSATTTVWAALCYAESEPLGSVAGACACRQITCGRYFGS